MKKTVLTLENDFDLSDNSDNVIYRVQNGYAAGSEVDGISDPNASDATNTENNYLNSREKYKIGKNSDNPSVFNSFEKDQLNNFAEWRAGYTAIVTNIGLIAFINDNKNDLSTLYIYDILDKESEKLDDVGFDLSPFSSYDEFTTPMNHFYVEYKTIEEDGSIKIVFPIKRVIFGASGSNCKVPSDYVERGGTDSSNNGLFYILGAKDYVDSLQYNFSQGIRIKNIISPFNDSEEVNIVFSKKIQTHPPKSNTIVNNQILEEEFTTEDYSSGKNLDFSNEYFYYDKSTGSTYREKLILEINLEPITDIRPGLCGLLEVIC